MVTEFPEVFESKAPPQWATFAPERSPSFKLHTSLGLALSAIANKKPHQEVALYHLEVVYNTMVHTFPENTLTYSTTSSTSASSGYHLGSSVGEPAWKKVWEYVFPTNCSECLKPYLVKHYHLPYNHKGTVKDAPVICGNCYKDQRDQYIAEQQRLADLKKLAHLKELYPDN